MTGKQRSRFWNSKRYDACLFFCHLVLEKLLKGLVVKRTEKAAPCIHDLAELLKTTGIFDKQQTKKNSSVYRF